MKMKSLMTTMAAFAILAGAGAIDANAQFPQYNAGPGIAMSGSATEAQLPDKAKAFIDKHYKDATIRKCEQYYAKGKYEVELSNGIDLEFNTSGDIVEVDAPGRSVLPASVVKEVLPHKAYSRLEKDGYANNVESIEFNKGRVVEVDLQINDPDTYVFDINGEFIALED